MIFGAIVAGGIGSRMKIADVPKQFLPLKNKPIIIHTIEKFLLNQRIDKIYIGVHADWILYTKDLIKKYNLDENRLNVTAGGTDRTETILNVLKAIQNDFLNTSEHIVITHDAVRPFVTNRIIEDNIDAAIKYGACDTVVNAVDTIIVSDNGKTISQIPNRNFMYQGQTPQSFKMDLLLGLYKQLNEDEKKVLTDTCGICMAKNVPVQLVRGEYSNLKITTIDDYKLAEAMVGGISID